MAAKSILVSLHVRSYNEKGQIINYICMDVGRFTTFEAALKYASCQAMGMPDNLNLVILANSSSMKSVILRGHLAVNRPAVYDPELFIYYQNATESRPVLIDPQITELRPGDRFRLSNMSEYETSEYCLDTDDKTISTGNTSMADYNYMIEYMKGRARAKLRICYPIINDLVDKSKPHNFM